MILLLAPSQNNDLIDPKRKMSSAAAVVKVNGVQDRYEITNIGLSSHGVADVAKIGEVELPIDVLALKDRGGVEQTDWVTT